MGELLKTSKNRSSLLHRLIAVLGACAALAGLAACSSSAPEVKSLFPTSPPDATSCPLSGENTLRNLDSYIPNISSVTPKVALEDVQTVPGVKNFSCAYESKAGVVLLSVLKGAAAPSYLASSPTVSLRYGGSVSVLSMPLAEGFSATILPDEAVFVAAPGVVPRSALKDTLEDVLRPSGFVLPRMDFPQGIRPVVDVYRLTVALSVCGKSVILASSTPSETSSASTIPAASGPFFSPLPGVVDVSPRAPSDAYSRATIGRVVEASGVTLLNNRLSLSGTPLGTKCSDSPASPWVWLFEDIKSNKPTSGPLPADEAWMRPLTKNGTRILLEVASKKPSSPSISPKAPDISYDVTRGSTTP